MTMRAMVERWMGPQAKPVAMERRANRCDANRCELGRDIVSATCDTWQNRGFRRSVWLGLVNYRARRCETIATK